MIDLKPTLLSALATLPAHITASFPQADLPLPVIAVSDEAGGVLAQADGLPCLDEYLIAVNIYAADAAGAEALASQADEALTALGLRCRHRQDFFDEEARAYRKYLRYRAVLKQNLIYQ